MRRDEFTEMRAFLEVPGSGASRALPPSWASPARPSVTRSARSRSGLASGFSPARPATWPDGGRGTSRGEHRAPFREHRRRDQRDQRAARQAIGPVRIVCPDDAVELVFRPRLPAFLRDYPDVTVELIVDNGFTNIVERQFDAGVRLGEAIARDMVAVRIGPDVPYAVVGSPEYFARPCRADKPAGPDRPQLRQLAASNVRRDLCLGVREGRPRVQRPGGRPAHLEQHRARDRRCPGRRGSGLCAQGPRPAICRERSAAGGACGLVPDLPRLSSLLSEPAQSLACLLRVRRSFPISI